MPHRYVLTLIFASLCTTPCIAMSIQNDVGPTSSAPTPQIFGHGVVSRPANDGSPAFSPGGHTTVFTRTTASWG